MLSTKLQDGTEIFCLQRMEAKVLDYHVKGYFQYGIALSQDDIVFDVGANIGVFGVRAVQAFSGIQVYAFEPVPAIHEVMAANAERYGKGRFHALRYGVGEAPGELKFTYFPNSPALSTSHPDVWENDPKALEQATLSQVRNAPPELWYARWLPEFVCRWISRRMRQNSVEVQAEIVTVSAIMRRYNLDRIDLLKIDCEGAEYDVLLGVEKADWAKIKQVVVEVFNLDNRLDKVIALLKENGFTQLVSEEEDALKQSNLYNVYARK